MAQSLFSTFIRGKELPWLGSGGDRRQYWLLRGPVNLAGNFKRSLEWSSERGEDAGFLFPQRIESIDTGDHD